MASVIPSSLASDVLSVKARAKPSTAGFLLLGSPAPALGGICHLYVDARRPWLGLPWRTDSRGQANLNFYVPNIPACHGTELMAQAGFGPTPTIPFGIDWTGGMKLTLGK